MRRRVAAALLVVLGALCAGPAGASAHPLLVTAAPAPGALLPGSPTTVTLAFSETSVPSGSRVTVSGPGGHPVATGRLRPAAGGRQLTTRLSHKLAPGVYVVRWVALGDDGHSVSGTFAFGVDRHNGAPPPGAGALGGAGTAGRGGDAAGQSLVATVFEWIGVLGASLLWSGWLLLAALRRRRGDDNPSQPLDRAEDLVARARPVLLASAFISALVLTVTQASAGAGGGLDLGLLTASGTGVSALVRLGVAVVGAALVLALSRRTPTAATIGGLTGGALLVTDGLTGHVLAQHTPAAALAMAAHVLAAGTWAGGTVAILALARTAGLAPGRAVRAYAPAAIAGLGIAVVTGVIAAVREVNHWYFLFWSSYGRMVIVKAVLVGIAAALGAVMTLRLRDSGRLSARLPGAEAAVVLVVLAVAGVLSGLAQGRGQPLPAQSGDLLPGPALTSVVTPTGPAPVTLSPARPGTNMIVVRPPGHANSVLVRLACGCDPRPVIAQLRRQPGGAFAASVPVPTAGTWNGQVTVDGRAAGTPVSMPVGVAGAPGAPVRDVLAVADLSGPGARRCTNFLIGAELAIGRINGSGGVDGGDKLALRAFDDGGSSARAAAIARTGLGGDGPVAVLPCGAGAEPSVAAAQQHGIPVLEGDPATGDVAGSRVFRLAADPYADGTALAQAIHADVAPVSVRTARTVRVLFADDAQGQRRLDGFRTALAASSPGLRIKPISAATIDRASSAQISVLLDREHTVALVLDATDAQAPALAAAIARLPASAQTFRPAPVLASERLLSEGFVEQAGNAGKLGVVQGTSTVSVDSRDGLLLAQALPTLFPGYSASLEGLRGYATGLALAYGVRDGTSADLVTARLTRPAPFTDAVPEPWRSDAPAAGAQRLTVLDPTFLSATLLPVSSGGEAYTGDYFPNGAWERPTTQLFGPSMSTPVPALTGR